MTKEQVYKKVKEILAKDKRFNNVTIFIKFNDKKGTPKIQTNKS